MKAIGSAPELYAHAIAIEREAAARYSELAQQMSDRGNDAVAEVFSNLARAEARHLDALERGTEGVALPQIAEGEYRWLDAGAPETAAHEWLFSLITPRQALLIALDAERRAEAFFEGVLLAAHDPALRALAREMALEESEHVRIVQQLIERTPDPVVNWASVYETSKA
jgi:rubrerythrin